MVAAGRPAAAVEVVVGTAVGVVVDTVVGERELASTEEVVVVVGVQDQGGTVSVVGEVVSKVDLSAS